MSGLNMVTVSKIEECKVCKNNPCRSIVCACLQMVVFPTGSVTKVVAKGTPQVVCIVHLHISNWIRAATGMDISEYLK